MLDHAAQSGRHALSERGADLYETPACAVEALLRVEQLPHQIWEPAAGRGAIVNVLCGHGHAVIASDLFDYGFPLHFVADFLTAQAPLGCDCILTNPPFQIIGEFVAHALDLAPRVIMLARLAFLESERRTNILEKRGLARIHAFRNRLPMMHSRRLGWPARFERRRILLVCLGSGPPWPADVQQNFVGGRAMTRQRDLFPEYRTFTLALRADSRSDVIRHLRTL
jgi:hypothetical protein